MLAALLLTPLVLGIELRAGPASGLQAYTDQKEVTGHVPANLVDIYTFTIEDPAMEWIMFSLTPLTGDPDLQVETKVFDNLKIWTSAAGGSTTDIVFILKDSSDLEGQGLARDYVVAVKGFRESDYTLTVQAGTDPYAARNFKSIQSYTGPKEDFPTQESGLGTFSWCLISLGVAALAVVGGNKVYQHQRKSRLEGGYDLLKN